MKKKKVSIIITDLDNTLYDWFKVWHSSFRAMLDSAISISGISEEELIPEIKKVHEKHGTSEYLMLLNELKSLKKKHPNEELTNVYREAIREYKEKRAETLELYPTVLETLIKLKNKGCIIIGYTDSQTLYTAFRVKELGLDGVFDYLYSSPTHEFDENNHSETEHFFPSTNNTLKKTINKQTPQNASKPNPEVLTSIIDDIGASSHEAIYIGDSLLNDISMAKAVPITDIHAKYGTSHTKEEYELLKKVTHWKDEKVKKEQETEITSSFTLENSFEELIDLFNFIPFIKKEDKENEITNAVDIWKKTVDVQQHFNDLELRIRNYAFTILGITLSASALAFKDYETSYLSWVLVIVGLGLWLMFFMMDKYWYHKLLKGSVEHAEEIEKKYKDDLPAFGLTSTISEFSRGGKKSSGSNKRLGFFYIGIAILLLILSAVYFYAWMNREAPKEKKVENPIINVINNSQSPINTKIENTNTATKSLENNSKTNKTKE